MQDSIYHMTLKWHLIWDFAVKGDLSVISIRDIIKDVNA